MRVLYFHQHFGTLNGSTGTRSYEFARALVARGHSVTMVCGASAHNGVELVYDAERKWSRGSIQGIDVIALPVPYSNKDGLLRRSLMFLKFGLRSTTLALRENYDVLFATSTPLTAGIPGIAMKLCGRSKPFVFEVRDLWPELPKALGMRNPLALGAMNWLEWLSYHTADACIGLSPGIVEGIRKRSRRNQIIEMVPNGCDLDLFHPRARCRAKLDFITDGTFVAGFTGAHGKANGLDAVLAAARELKARRRNDIKLVLIGEGNQKSRLVEVARGEGLDNVVFLPPMRKTDIAAVTASFDCGLMILANVPAFYFGTSPNKFFDYIAAGVPILSNYPGWIANLISESQCGRVVAPGDPSAFADALCHLADDSEARGRMSLNARRLAESQFSRAELSARFCTLIECVGKIYK